MALAGVFQTPETLFLSGQFSNVPNAASLQVFIGSSQCNVVAVGASWLLCNTVSFNISSAPVLNASLYLWDPASNVITVGSDTFSFPVRFDSLDSGRLILKK